MKRADAVAHVRSIARVCRGPIHPDAAKVRDALLSDGRHDEAADEDKAGRPGCGRNFNDVIVAAPFDGAVRSHGCKCGASIGFQSPLIHIDADDTDRLEGDPVPSDEPADVVDTVDEGEGAE